MNNINLDIYIDLIYDVPLGKSSWLDVLEAFKKELEAKMALLFLARIGEPPLLITTTVPDEKIWGQYMEYFSEIDPWNAILMTGNMPRNYIHFGRAFIPEKEFKATEYFADFWSKLHLGETIGGQLVTNKGITVQLGIPRHHDQSNYEMSHTLALNYYSQHIIRAIDLEGYLGESLPSGIYEHALIEKFGLSQAESQLVLQLIKSESTKQAALCLNRSYHTVRTQLKSIYKKTNSNNQLTLFKTLLNPN